MEGPDPALPAIVAQRLSGMSGCDVHLASHDGTTWFVRKVAGTPALSPRLRAQALKQRSAVAAGGPLSVPEIIDEGEAEGRYWFDMPFVVGVDGATYLRRAPLDAVDRLATLLTDHLVTVAAQPLAGPAVDLSVVYGDRIERAISAQDVERDLQRRIRSVVESLRGASVRPTACHGDLTLENIIVGPDERVWVVDVSDPPVEHWWQDVAKLHQDLTGEWYRRRLPAIAPSVVRHVRRRVLDAAIGIDAGYEGVHDALVLLTFVRVLPYAVTADARDFVLSKLRRLTDLVAV